jgi:23S rRNA (cytidine1920-2'-O)/16S rRNA (cytidine1409-2'-O)-methyltransferase
VTSRTEAQRAIDAGLVRVGSTPSPKASTLVSDDESVHLVAGPDRFVSRAGHKLEGALDAWDIDVSGMRAIDLGASTGGFTDCLLQRSVASVVAVDVGYGQMHWRIRGEPAVVVVERTNIRLADPEELGAPFDLVVGDLSFISLRLLAPQIAALGGADTTWILLVKPQFEAGPELVGRGGIVSDPSVHVEVLRDVIAAYESVGLGCQRLAVSSITGATGNIEFVALFTTGRRTIDESAVRAVVEGHSA